MGGNARGRACFLHLLLAEVHPFADGNGRIARLFVNSELVGDGQARMIVPTAFRSDYLSCLEALTGNSLFQPLPDALDWMQRFVRSIPWDHEHASLAVLKRVGAFERPNSQTRLRIPTVMIIDEEIAREEQFIPRP